MNNNKIIVIGSGWASSSFIKQIDTKKYDVTVISTDNNFIYTPLLASNLMKFKNLKYNIKDLNKINFRKGTVVNINFDNNKVITENDNKHEYDYLILAHGSEINTFGIKGINDNCYFLKSTENADNIRNKLKELPNGSKIAVIGCSLTGSEIIGNLIDYNKFKIYAIDGLKYPLSSFNYNISKYTLDLWKSNNVNIYLNNFVSKIDRSKIYFKDNEIDYDLAIWCGGIKKSKLSDEINKLLNIECKFGIPVNSNLKVNNTKNVYALGDCAYSKNLPTAQVAYQQGYYLANHFNNNFKGGEFKFINKGQICYIGKGISVYQNNKIYFKGKLTGYLNNVIHIYNSINLKQAVKLFEDIYTKF